jgi:hypothetical protein
VNKREFLKPCIGLDKFLAISSKDNPKDASNKRKKNLSIDSLYIIALKIWLAKMMFPPSRKKRATKNLN